MLSALSFPQLIMVFAAAAVVVTVCGVAMTNMADRLADLTGLGEAVTGAVLLGATTSLAGTVVSVTSSLDGRASMAFSNGVGGIAAQTAFLALADLVWRKGNLEHSAADISNIFQAALLALMLSVPLIAFAGPEFAVLGVHPASAALVALYVAGLFATGRIREQPMWRPVATRETREDAPDEEQARSIGSVAPLIARFAGLALLLGMAGWVIALSGGRLADAAGISETAVGSLLTAVSTSLPELVTTVAAVRRGAAQLAVGGIIGGNVFDVLFLTLSDAAWREGSLYHAIGPDDVFWLGVGLAMTATLLLGLISRQKSGPAGIGFESLAMLAIYAGAVVVQSFNAGTGS